MSGLILKDLYVLIKQLRIFLLLTPIFMLSGEFVAILFILMLYASLPMTAMGYDEQSKWTSYAEMLPYSKSSLVISKYVLGYVLLSFAIMLSLIIGLIVNAVKVGSIGSYIDVRLLIIGVSMTLIFIAINVFINFKFGVEKGRIIFIMCFALIGAMSSLINSVDKSNIMKILEMPPIIFLLVAIVINICSIFLSIKTKKKQ